MNNSKKYLNPTKTINCDASEILETAVKLSSNLKNQTENAKALYYFVRDHIKYRITFETLTLEYFKASETLKRGFGFCIPKAILLAALARSQNIPAKLHFVDIRNHQLPAHLKSKLKTDLMAYHAYVELFLNKRWLKVNPAFDIKMCEKYNIIPVEFSGTNDALFHHLDRKGRLHIEYLEESDHGIFDDLPYEQILAEFKKVYPHLF